MGELCTLSRIQPDRVDELSVALATLPNGVESPFRLVPGTHFARWAVVPGLPGRNRRIGPASSARLIFGAEFDHADPEEFLRQVLELAGAEARLVWSHCVGYPDPPGERLVPWLLADRLPAGFSVVANPGATVEEVREALALRAEVAAFAAEGEKIGRDELQARWLARFDPERSQH